MSAPTLFFGLMFFPLLSLINTHYHPISLFPFFFLSPLWWGGEKYIEEKRAKEEKKRISYNCSWSQSNRPASGYSGGPSTPA
jgi:hypothetical protein